jgi:hypothetical protein
VIVLVTMALAGEPVVTLTEDSWIEGYIDIAALPEEVFATVSAPAAVAAIDGTVRATATPQGNCIAVHTEVIHPIASATYDSLSCPDGELAVAQVLTGGDMKEFGSRWWVQSSDTGARAHYRVRTIPKMWVPQFVVNRSSVRSVEHLLTKLAAHFEEQ